MKNKIILFAPEGYQKLTIEQKAEICNGCGAKGGIKVPSTFYGLDISEACQIHDYMYHIGTTYNDKIIADRVFKNNLSRIIEARTSFWILKQLRHSRKRKYVFAVSEFGDSAYWSDKNKPQDLKEIF